MIVDIKFYEELALEMKKLKCSEMFIKADDVIELANRLREAEKDAARYRWLMENAKLGIGRNGKDWDLQVDGPAPDSISEVSAWIDSHPDLMRINRGVM